MNIEYKRIDNNNFVVLNERGDETFYHIDGNIEDWEITGFVFLQNEIEWKMKELIELTQNKHDLKMNLLHLRKYLLSMKRINYKINNT